jgi:hypothetical protein
MIIITIITPSSIDTANSHLDHLELVTNHDPSAATQLPLRQSTQWACGMPSHRAAPRHPPSHRSQEGTCTRASRAPVLTKEWRAAALPVERALAPRQHCSAWSTALLPLPFWPLIMFTCSLRSTPCQ